MPDPAFLIKLFLLAYRGCIQKGFYRKRESHQVTQRRLKCVLRTSHEPLLVCGLELSGVLVFW